MNNMAIVFPGQGSQQTGILSDLYKNYKNIIKNTFEEASDILNYNMWKLIQKNKNNEINLTYKTQPAILTVSVALWRILQNFVKFTPYVMVGHSFGEYSALVCANSLSFSEAIKLVYIRGKLMQKLLIKNSYVSVYVILGLNPSIVGNFCEFISKENEFVSISAYNSPEQTVITGNDIAVNKVIKKCKELGSKCIKLNVKVPSHCSLMKPILKRFSNFLKKIKISKPIIPVLNNAYNSVENDPKKIKKALVTQLYKIVYWNKISNYFYLNKINTLIEIGYKNILINLTKKNIGNIKGILVNNNKSLNKIYNLISKINEKQKNSFSYWRK
ncbi:MAG: ACP S-malonyltransferase [Enterobacteriaceae bacterium]